MCIFRQLGVKGEYNMSIVIAMSNHKGGVGKTTSLSCLADLWGKNGKKVLLVDTDTQGNLSQRFGYPPNLHSSITLGDAVRNILSDNPQPLINFIQPTKNPNIFILPNDDRYAMVVKDMLNEVMAGINSYKILVNELSSYFDYILFDTKPAVDDEIRQIMLAVEWVLIPSDAADDSLNGASNTLRFIKASKRGNPNLKVGGIFFNAVNMRTSVAKSYVPQIKEAWKDMVFDTIIPYSQDAKKAEGEHKPVTEYEPEGKVSLAFMELVKEVDKRIG